MLVGINRRGIVRDAELPSILHIPVQRRYEKKKGKYATRMIKWTTEEKGEIESSQKAKEKIKGKKKRRKIGKNDIN